MKLYTRYYLITDNFWCNSKRLILKAFIEYMLCRRVVEVGKCWKENYTVRQRFEGLSTSSYHKEYYSQVLLFITVKKNKFNIVIVVV